MGREKSKVRDLMIQPSVAAVMEGQYDRYCQVEFMSGRTPMDMMDFVNQLIVRGMVAYSGYLLDAEIAVMMGRRSLRMFDVVGQKNRNATERQGQ